MGQIAALPVVPSAIAILVALGAWQVASAQLWLPAYVLPSPARVLAAWLQVLTNGALLRHVSATLSEALIGFGVALVAGSALAYPLAHSATMSRLASPFIATTQALPMIALAPLLVMWFGLGLTSKVIICALIVFFPILVNTESGLRSVDRDLIEASWTMGGSGWQTLRYIEIPLALRPLLAGIRMGLTLAITGAVVGEFVAASAGLGYLMNYGRTLYDAPMVFAASLTMALVAMLGYALVSALERLLITWE